MPKIENNILPFDKRFQLGIWVKNNIGTEQKYSKDELTEVAKQATQALGFHVTQGNMLGFRDLGMIKMKSSHSRNPFMLQCAKVRRLEKVLLGLLVKNGEAQLVKALTGSIEEYEAEVKAEAAK